MLSEQEERDIANAFQANRAKILGVGGAPTRATTFPSDATSRKQRPVASGVLDYFPDALVAVAEVSYRGNEQHNPGQPLHWARGKSADEADALIRHFLQRGSLDCDGLRHSAKMAWRALALLQKEIEAGVESERKQPPTLTSADILAGAKSPIECHGIEKHTHPFCEGCREKGKCRVI